MRERRPADRRPAGTPPGGRALGRGAAHRGRRGWRSSTAAGALAIARVNRRRALGDRRLVFVATAMPLLIILVVGLLVGSPTRVPLGVVRLDRGPLATRLVDLLRQSDAVTVRTSPSAGAASDDVLRGILAGAVVIPADFDARLRDGGTPEVQMVGQQGSVTAAQARAAVTAAADVLSAEWAAAVTATPAGHLPPGSARRRAALLGRAEALTDAAYARVRAHETPPLSPYAYITPANLVLFVFLTALVASAGIVESRRLGTLRRILASPTPARAVVGGQLLVAVTLAVGQSCGLLVVGRVLFGIDWGDPVGTGLLVLALSLAAAGASVLLGTVARTTEQAIAVGTVAGIAMGMLGGCIWPLNLVGSTMRAVGHATPQAWAMDAFVGLVYGHSGLVGILPQLGVLTAMAVVLLVVAGARLRAAVAEG